MWYLIFMMISLGIQLGKHNNYDDSFPSMVFNVILWPIYFGKIINSLIRRVI